VSTTQRATKLTVDEFLAEYANIDDGNFYELQDGELIVSPPPGSEHGELHMILGWLLGIYEETHPGFRVFDSSGVEFADDTLRGPDVTIVKPEDDIKFIKSRMAGVPSLIIEIVSPYKKRLDLVVKRGLFTSKRVSEIWYLDVDTQEALFLCRSRSGGYAEQKLSSGVFESKVLKGLRVDVAALFALDKKRLRKALEGRKS